MRAPNDAPDSYRPRRPRLDSQEAQEAADKARDLLARLLELSGFDVSVEGRADPKAIVLSVRGSDAPLLLEGNHGAPKLALLDTYSMLLRRMVFDNERDAVPIIIDADDYRIKRVEHLRYLATTLGDKARAGVNLQVFGMNSVDRRAVHKHVSASFSDV
ncbi:MAG: hypothetical protein RBU37_06410, partial [Myxococcota bacterium]|nr:hypothetical protein [Myxococcota bacterium]